MPQYYCVKNLKFFLPDSKSSRRLLTFCNPCYCHPRYSPTIAEMIRYVNYKRWQWSIIYIFSTRLFLYAVSVQQSKWTIWTIFIKLYSRSRSHFNVVWFTLQFFGRSISSEPFERFIVNFIQNVPLSETVCRTHKPGLQSQGQGQLSRTWDLLPSISCPLHISWTLWTIFIKLHPNVPFGETLCRTHASAMESRGQCHSSRTWDLPLKLVSATYLQNPLKDFFIKFHKNVPLSETVCRSNDSATKTL